MFTPKRHISTPEYREDRIIKPGLVEWTKAVIQRGFCLYELTFQWMDLPGSESSKILRMTRHLEYLYSRLVTHVLDDPSKFEIADFPLMVAAPDYPVAKSEAKAFHPPVLTNDGLHFHAMYFMPPWSKMRVPFADLLSRTSALTFKSATIENVHCIFVTETPAAVCSYNLKSWWRIKDAELLVLPRTHDEMAKNDRPNKVWRAT